jgi:hypothetical protein
VACAWCALCEQEDDEEEDGGGIVLPDLEERFAGLQYKASRASLLSTCCFIQRPEIWTGGWTIRFWSPDPRMPGVRNLWGTNTG